MVALSPKDKMLENFRKQFVHMDGQDYFTLRNIPWMLPVDEDVPWKKESLFLTIYGIVRAMEFSVLMGLGFYLILLQQWRYFLVLIPIILIGIAVHVMTLALPNLDLWNRLRTLDAQPEEIKRQFLTRKPRRK